MRWWRLAVVDRLTGGLVQTCAPLITMQFQGEEGARGGAA